MDFNWLVDDLVLDKTHQQKVYQTTLAENRRVKQFIRQGQAKTCCPFITCCNEIPVASEYLDKTQYIEDSTIKLVTP